MVQGTGKSGFNQEKIQKMNRTLLLNTLLKEGVCSRVYLANSMKLKPATITNIVNDFIRYNIVKEVGLLTGSKGRRSIGISINNDDYGVFAVRLSRKNYSVGIFNLSGSAICMDSVEIDPADSPEKVFDDIIKKGKRMIKEAADRKIIAIGMATPGPYSVKEGRIEIMTGFLGWNKIPMQEMLEEAFHIPVFIENDANAGALAQYWHNNEPMKDKMLVYIAVGQGVGSGIIHNGEVIYGTIGTAGEIGHTSINYAGPRCSCGNYGCLEMYCSSIAFLREVNRELKPERELSLSDISERIRGGDERVRDIYLKACDMLAIGIVNIINSLNPAVVVIGDEMAHVAPDIMLERVISDVRERVLPSLFADTEIRMSNIKNDSLVHGAALAAIREIFANPEGYFFAG